LDRRLFHFKPSWCCAADRGSKPQRSVLILPRSQISRSAMLLKHRLESSWSFCPWVRSRTKNRFSDGRTDVNSKTRGNNGQRSDALQGLTSDFSRAKQSFCIGLAMPQVSRRAVIGHLKALTPHGLQLSFVPPRRCQQRRPRRRRATSAADPLAQDFVALIPQALLAEPIINSA
jgi:hypothetical protein